MVMTIFFLSILLEIDVEFIDTILERLLRAIFVDLLFNMIEALVNVATSLVGETFLGIVLTLILVGTGAMAINRAVAL